MIVASVLALSCAERGTNAEERASPEPLGHADRTLVIARQDEKAADDIEQALSERWQSVATIVDDSARPFASMASVLRERGLADPEGGLPAGVFSDRAARRRYFAALLLGWTAEPAALRIAARVEAQRLASLSAAHAELPDVEQRLALDVLARAASDRLHAFCQRLAALGGACSDTAERSSSELGPRSANERRSTASAS
jgi:hypothetical protein